VRAVTASTAPLATVLTDLAALGRKLVETSESALALLREREAQCRPDAAERALQNPMPTIPSRLLTQSQVAEVLQISSRTLARTRNDPAAKFPKPIRRSRVLRWRRHDVEAWIEARR
jgi:predicted DNA-binding transcriptional regulator AlpA